MTIDLVCDISGSMVEGGKPFIMRSLVMAVGQWVRIGCGREEVRLFGWASEARYFRDWSTEDEFPLELLVCGGTAKGEALVRSLGEKPKGKVLLLTDGFWRRDESKVLKNWKDCLPPDTLRVIKIGADANSQLKGPEVFAAEDLFVALDGWLEEGST